MDKMDFNDCLIMATYQNDYALVRELIESDEFDEGVIHDTGLLHVPFPLYYITICNRKVLSSGFRDELKPLANAHLRNVELLLDLWKNRFGVNTDIRMDYSRYKCYFFCDSDQDTIEDIMCEPVSKFLDNGCRQIDIDLFFCRNK